MKKLADRSKEVIIHKKTLLGTVGRWPRPLNRGGRLKEVVSLLIYNKYFRDFDNWPFNRGWPLNGGPLNRGSTVCRIITVEVYQTLSKTLMIFNITKTESNNCFIIHFQRKELKNGMPLHEFTENLEKFFTLFFVAMPYRIL